MDTTTPPDSPNGSQQLHGSQSAIPSQEATAAPEEPEERRMVFYQCDSPKESTSSDSDEELEPRAIFARVLSQIVENGPVAWPANREPRRPILPGYLCLIKEAGNTSADPPIGGPVCIIWGSTIRIKDVLAHIQQGNPRPLDVLGVGLRDNAQNAREICETLHRGLQINRIRGNWFMVNSYARIRDMLSHIDDESEAPS